MLSYNTSGSKSIVNFEEIHGGNKSNVAVCRQSDKDENGEEDLDSFLHQTEKKRRLTVNQVQNLEKSFEVENKLEPERKFELAKELGLQPRQVAIWFQNRRARFKTKQLEKDYDSLKASYNCLRADYDSIVTENEKLKTEVQILQSFQIYHTTICISEAPELGSTLRLCLIKCLIEIHNDPNMSLFKNDL